MRTTPLRTFGLIALIWVAVGAAVYTKERSWNTTVRDAGRLQMESDKQVWEMTHSLADSTSVSSVTDYSFWNDMVDFAEGKFDDVWATENLSPGLSSLHLSALWVLRADGTTRFSATMDNGSAVAAPPLPFEAATLKELFATPGEDGGPVHELYWFSPIGPLTLFGAEITTTDDPGHEKAGRGYYFVANAISAEAMQSQLDAIGATIEIIATSSLPPEITPNETRPHVFWHRMFDSSDKTIGAIRITRSSGAFSALIGNTQQSRYLTTILWIATGLIATGLVVSLSRTRSRAESLATQITAQLRDTNTVLEQRVAERTKELADDIQRREAFEAQLTQRSRDLEQMNKAMVDRELRIVELKNKVEKLEREGTATS